jgi:DNA-binding LacI/PurR family transcriptional regulator
LFVYPDTSARGVMGAALELGVRVPEDLKLIFHHNTGVSWHCPLAVDWIETDTAQWADEMIRQVRRQMEGGEVAPVAMPYQLRMHSAVVPRDGD